MKDSPPRPPPGSPAPTSPIPLWRKAQLVAAGAAPGGGSAGAGDSNYHQTLVWVVLRCMSFFSWCKEQWLLWSALATVMFAYWVPLLTSSDDVTAICVAVIFFLCGLSSPLEDLRHAFSNLQGIVLALFHTFVLSPLLIVGIYLIPLHADLPPNGKRLLLSGMLCTFCFPPSTASAIVSTSAASGSESIAVCVSTIGNVLGLVLSPLLLRLLPAVTETRSIDYDYRGAVTFAGRFVLVAVIPLVAGQALQWIGVTLMRHPGDDLKRHVTSTAAFCSDVCDANQRNWRGKLRALMYLVVLFLSYTLFCSLFYNKQTLKDKMSWDAVFYVFCVELVAYAALCGCAWLTTGLLPLAPEDRVATFFSAIGKTEVFAIPMLSQVFVHFEDLAVLALPALIYHLIQCVGGSLLTFPLRQWRNRQHCKPGTTLLPLRYIRVPKHHHQHHHGGKEGSSAEE